MAIQSAIYLDARLCDATQLQRWHVAYGLESESTSCAGTNNPSHRSRWKPCGQTRLRSVMSLDTLPFKH